MRVIAGRFRGVPLDAPPGTRTRPITDRAKETLFNVLGSRLGTLAELPDFDVIDLFAGPGSLGIESLSRGARSCIFVERDRAALAVLRGNLARLRLGSEARIHIENIWTMHAPPGEFGLIFVDPPYRDADDEPRLSDLLDRFARRLAQGGLIVLRYEGYARASDRIPPGLRAADERQLGTMHIALLERASRPSDANVAPRQQPEEEHRTEDVGDNADRQRVDGH